MGKVSLEIIMFFPISILERGRRDLIITIDRQGGEGSPQVKQQITGRNEARLQIKLPSQSRLILQTAAAYIIQIQYVNPAIHMTFFKY